MSSGEEMVSCPHNSLHRMLRKHLQKHLLKCQLSNPESEMRKCLFNATHIIPDSEYEMHMRLCPDKAIIRNQIYETSVATKFSPVSNQPVDDDNEDNWDDDEHETYDPQKYAATAPIIRSNIGNLPSQRKEFRKAELRRHGEKLSDDDD